MLHDIRESWPAFAETLRIPPCALRRLGPLNALYNVARTVDIEFDSIDVYQSRKRLEHVLAECRL